MHFRQKLTFMAFGSILTLAGYLLATIASDVTAQLNLDDFKPIPAPETKNATFDLITCKRLIVVNEKGIPAVDIDSDSNGGSIEVVKANGKTIVKISIDSNGGYMEVNHADGGRGVTIGISDDEDKGGLVSAWGKEGGSAQLYTNEYGGRVNIISKTDKRSRVLLGINEKGHGSINTWDKNRYRTFP